MTTTFKSLKAPVCVYDRDSRHILSGMVPALKSSVRKPICKSERWITINSDHEGGGTHIKIDDSGKIVGGPAALADKGIRSLNDFGKGEKNQHAKVASTVANQATTSAQAMSGKKKPHELAADHENAAHAHETAAIAHAAAGNHDNAADHRRKADEHRKIAGETKRADKEKQKRDRESEANEKEEKFTANTDHSANGVNDKGDQEKQPHEMTADEFAKSGAKTFQTSQGSVYSHQDGKTVRVKTQHEGHDSKDVGLKKQSDETHYVSPEGAKEIGMWQTLSSKGKRIIRKDNELLLTSENPKTGQRGLDGRIKIESSEPKPGLAPVELFDKSSQGEGWYRGNHPGNAITSMVDPKEAHGKFVAASGAGDKGEAAGDPGANLKGHAKDTYDDYKPILEKQVGREVSPRKQAAAADSVLHGINPDAQQALVDHLRTLSPEAYQHLHEHKPLHLRHVKTSDAVEKKPLSSAAANQQQEPVKVAGKSPIEASNDHEQKRQDAINAIADKQASESRKFNDKNDATAFTPKQMAKEYQSGTRDFSHILKETGVYTDGKVLIKPPEKMKEQILGNSSNEFQGFGSHKLVPQINQMITDASRANTQQMRPIGERTVQDLDKRGKGSKVIDRHHTLLSAADGTHSLVDSKYVRTIQKMYPDATYHEPASKHGPVIVKNGGDTVGVLMPLSGDEGKQDSEISEHVKRVTGATKPVRKSLSGSLFPKQRQPLPTFKTLKPPVVKFR